MSKQTDKKTRSGCRGSGVGCHSDTALGHRAAVVPGVKHAACDGINAVTMIEAAIMLRHFGQAKRDPESRELLSKRKTPGTRIWAKGQRVTSDFDVAHCKTMRACAKQPFKFRN